mgnify:CR=1 FL=1
MPFLYQDEDGHKPDPHLFIRATLALNAQRTVMVGDSIDDLRTVLNYRQLSSIQQETEAFAVQIAPTSESQFWVDQGADVVIPNVNDLPSLLSGVRSNF